MNYSRNFHINVYFISFKTVEWLYLLITLILILMKLKDFKKKLDKLSKEQLEQDFIVIAYHKTLSGFGEARVSNANLIYTDDDPCELVTKQSLIDVGYKKEDIEEMEVVVRKGQFYVELP